MPSMLDQLRSMTTVVADTGDIDAVRLLKPIDCTTNPSIILKAIKAPEFTDAFREAIDWGTRAGGSIEARVAIVADRLAVSVGASLAVNAGVKSGHWAAQKQATFCFGVARTTRRRPVSRAPQTAGG